MVCAQQPALGWIALANLARNHGAGVAMDPPGPGATIQGYECAWAVESAVGMPTLALFAPVTFTDCMAATSGNQLFDLDPDGIVSEIMAAMEPR